jgi:RNA polymerase-binding transcription factor DksA
MATGGIRAAAYMHPCCGRTLGKAVALVDTDAIRMTLEKRLERLARTRTRMHVEGDGADGSELSNLDTHPADQGTETHERELDATTDVFFDEEERRIREALRALDAGTYGTCSGCGREIQPERLGAVPEAVMCLSCQTQVEAWHRQRVIRA